MKKILNLKLHAICLVFLGYGYFNVTLASSIQFAVDASLGPEELQVVRDVVTTITTAAGDSDSVGILIYDSVFQRSTPMAAADDAQKSKVLDTLAKMAASDNSNLAVGIEKGSSELASEGGFLLVFGQSEIRVADPEKLATYTDWLTLVLMPDSEKSGIDIVLVSPPAQDASASFQTWASAFFELSDTGTLVNELSTVLPESLLIRLNNSTQAESSLDSPAADETIVTEQVTQDAPVEQNTLPPQSEAITAGAAKSEENGLSQTQMLLIGISAALLFAVIAIVGLVFKLTRNTKKPAPIVNRQQLQETIYKAPDVQRSPLNSDIAPTVTGQMRRHIEIDEKMDKAFSDTDVTLKNPTIQSKDFVATMRRAPVVKAGSKPGRYEEALDDLEEIRALTKQREDSLI